MFAISRLVRGLITVGVSIAIIAGLPPPASAQVLFGAPNDILSAADFTRMHVAASHLYEYRELGAVERWSGPESKDSGSVERLRTFRNQGMPCTRLRYRIHFAKSYRSAQTYMVNWCKTDSGEWKIEDHTPPT